MYEDHDLVYPLSTDNALTDLHAFRPFVDVHMDTWQTEAGRWSGWGRGHDEQKCFSTAGTSLRLALSADHQNHHLHHGDFRRLCQGSRGYGVDRSVVEVRVFSAEEDSATRGGVVLWK
jgi:hypothetical protein